MLSTPLHAATYNGHIDILRILFSKGVTPEKNRHWFPVEELSLKHSVCPLDNTIKERIIALWDSYTKGDDRWKEERRSILSRKTTASLPSSISIKTLGASFSLDGQISEATMEKYVEAVTSDLVLKSDISITRLLLIYRLYCTPKEFFQIVVHRFKNIVNNKSNNNNNIKKIVDLFQLWISDFVNDFYEDTMKKELTDFNDGLTIDELDVPLVADLNTTIKNVLASNQRTINTDIKQTINMGSAPILEPKSFWSKSSMIIGYQLHHIDCKLWKEIWPNDVWNNNCLKLLMSHCERIIKWTSSEIVTAPDLLNQIDRIEKFIDVIKELVDLNNLMSSTCIFMGLDRIVQKEIFKQAISPDHVELLGTFKNLFDIGKNYYNMREFIQIKRKQQSNPIVPLPMIYAKDGIYWQEALQVSSKKKKDTSTTPTTIQTRMISLEKIRNMSGV
eukprot:TRINITY_DN3324_c0_g1_i8.p2 TRINITY_DN3324_c0_g1~~TRINITY_DN3324_c0_g1_i8.p2  ORF type:complete len:446 (-),score=77.58 TRINITY_DN3324_c0_g1_i8:1833-3170(-)